MIHRMKTMNFFFSISPSMKTTLVSTGATKEKYPELHVLTLDQTHQSVPVSGCPRKLGQAQLAEALNEPLQGLFQLMNEPSANGHWLQMPYHIQHYINSRVNPSGSQIDLPPQAASHVWLPLQLVCNKSVGCD
ncbi:hypothetical protein OIU84_022370 [Salix udensis]|uniref:Uncharacterized protein n=1 Tax=Salix udensis TaxID=889485 RepID=A0AAD6PEE7_9ROSI|nr:hypothetical protein OIU84_022370 [Salix udensis]